MNEAEIRKYARLMQELGLTGLEVKENLGVVRLERAGAASPAVMTAAAPAVQDVPAAPASSEVRSASSMPRPPRTPSRSSRWAAVSKRATRSA